jgi:hypothetical protein
MRQRPIDEWWNDLDPATRQWFLENPGCMTVPRTVANVVHQTEGTGTDQDRHGELQLTQQDHDFIRTLIHSDEAPAREQH